LINQAYDILKEKNLKITPQRNDILQILCNSKGHHIDIYTIYESVPVKGKKKMGLATIYRTMETFEKVGLVSRITMEKSPAQYELIIYDKSGHHHLICLKCGLVQEISDMLAGDFKARIQEEKNFKVIGKPMKIYGYCSKCRVEAETQCSQKAE
jgi:Fur family ferric uptake transcriptional regulator